MISTGIAELDKMLSGGIVPGTITDIYGPAASGKTQLAMQICLNSLHHGIILYQDTSGGFRPERMLQMIKSNEMNEKLLDNVIVSRIRNVSDQVDSLGKISHINPILVIIENITDLFVYEYYKDSNLLERHVNFMEYMHDLSLQAIHNKIPVLVTNSVRNADDKMIESLDKSISIFTHKKIRLEKNGRKYHASVFPSYACEKVISYTITESGLVATP